MAEATQPLNPSTLRWLSLDPAGLLWGSERALLDFIGNVEGTLAACCCPPHSPLEGKLVGAGVICYPFFKANLHQKGRFSRLLALAGLIRAIRTFRPHVIHVNQAGASRIALTACALNRLPCIVHVRIEEDVVYLANLKPSSRWLKGLIAISAPIEELIRAQPNLQGIPCYRLIDAYRPIRAASPSKSGTLSWDLICVGRFSESKGQGVLVEALKILKTNGIEPRVLFVGELNEFGKLIAEKVAGYGLSSTVSFAGQSDQVHDLIDQARWLVCPSQYEPLGRVLFEAWDCGIPVITGAFSGGAASSVNNSRGGLTYSDWNPDSLAEGIKQALQMNSSSEHALAASGRAWLLRHTDPSRYGMAFRAALKAAIV